MPTGTPAHATVTVRDAMLKTTRWSGLRPIERTRSVHCAHALTVAMHTVGPAPRANSDQKFTACDSERFDRLRPSGRSIFTADVATASPSSATKRTGSGRRKSERATAKQATPAATTAVTYTRAATGRLRNVGTADAAVLIAPSLRRAEEGARPTATC